MYDPMAAVRVLIPFVQIHERGNREGTSSSGVVGEVVGKVFEVITYPDFACFNGCKLGHVIFITLWNMVLVFMRVFLASSGPWRWGRYRCTQRCGRSCISSRAYLFRRLVV